jgi:hypothetical protein
MYMSTESDPLETQADDEMVMTMLQEHVPLSLLVDLSDPAGPPSTEILEEEGDPDTRWWEPTSF